ncbi:MAG: hypothetical protein CL557_11810 [Alphaproteobacteria bacterium]|nr:hypothetical protein [Alphaproteobacteria bacterium]|tara:strand:+ start:3060 stop:3308 length:249 start_codon:yes stop_codon:yes gene_type:complete
MEDRRNTVILAAEKALIELEKVIRQNIDLVELDPEKAKTAAQAKWVAIEDSLKIIDKIEELSGKQNESKKNKTFLGVENRIK